MCICRVDKLFDEANVRFKNTIAKKNIEGITLAQAMLEGVAAICKDAAIYRKCATSVQKVVEKIKSCLISDLTQKNNL